MPGEKVSKKYEIRKILKEVIENELKNAEVIVRGGGAITSDVLKFRKIIEF